jgi:eukaryotic-like serine/threonine-protein kinase
VVAMEFLDGENLSDAIARGAIPPERAVRIAIELCTFLEAAHSFEAVIGDRKLRSLVHGDLKPQNVRMTSDGSVKVLDFGIAKALSLSRKITRNDFGTTPYLSPERLDGDVNEFADLWAIGIMLHEMIRGRRPFDAPDTRRLERLIRARLPPQPLTGRCPVALEAIVAKLLGPNVAARYGSARAVREDLERLTSGTRTTAEEEGWPHRIADQEPTRRTTGPAPVAHEEATRRTRPPALEASARHVGSVAAGAASSRQGRRRKLLVLTAASIVVLGLTANECAVAGDARRVAADVSTQELNQLGDAWTAYENLSRRSRLGFGTVSLERSLTQRTLALADRVIANYRMALPTVREAQWKAARDGLARALPIAPTDRTLRAAYRYCDGHLHRINGEAHKARHEDAAAQRELTEAVASFREAADLRPEWPDPFLGLARTFIYGLEDIDRGADAVSQAERRGYKSTDRETGQLADGYRTRGNSLVRSARELSRMPQESDYLARAIESYQRALTLYTQASSLPTAPMNIRTTQRAIDQAQRRLDELTPVTIEPLLPTPEDSTITVPEPQSSTSTRAESVVR